MTQDVHGILLLDKPLHASSAGAVARAKRLFGARKAGHTGSLDPLATGMLPVCFGEATKFGATLLDADKTYRLAVRLGERTASADLESPVIETRPVPGLSGEDVAAALRAFPRDYDQVPPMHSALKQDGKPLYEYARAGEVRPRAPRRITLHSLQLRAWRSPDLEVDVCCSKGAYMRVLAEDLGERLGTIAHLAALRRLGVSPFSQQPLWTFEQLEALPPAGRLAALLPVDAALEALPHLRLASGDVGALRQGRAVQVPAAEPGPVRIYSDELGFLGLGQRGPDGRLTALRLISADNNRA